MSKEAMKHTPGPWVVCRGVVHQIPVASVAMDGLKLNVAHVTGIRNGEGLANARLIAAAPDLLEALQQATSALEWRWERVANRAAPVHETAIQEAYNQARAAIAKATGEKS